MTKTIQTERRWLRSVIAASAEPLPRFPWMRGNRPHREQADTQPMDALALPVIPRHPAPLFGRLGAVAAR